MLYCSQPLQNLFIWLSKNITTWTYFIWIVKDKDIPESSLASSAVLPAAVIWEGTMVPLKYGSQHGWRMGPSQTHMHGQIYRRFVFCPTVALIFPLLLLCSFPAEDTCRQRRHQISSWKPFQKHASTSGSSPDCGKRCQLQKAGAGSGSDLMFSLHISVIAFWRTRAFLQNWRVLMASGLTW